MRFCSRTQIVYLNTLEEHGEHLRRVFDWLREHKLFLSSNLKKINLFLSWMDIDDNSVHIDPSKIDKITEWRTP
jgi:hypothetical protein